MTLLTTDDREFCATIFTPFHALSEPKQSLIFQPVNRGEVKTKKVEMFISKKINDVSLASSKNLLSSEIFFLFDNTRQKKISTLNENDSENCYILFLKNGQ